MIWINCMFIIPQLQSPKQFVTHHLVLLRIASSVHALLIQQYILLGELLMFRKVQIGCPSNRTLPCLLIQKKKKKQIEWLMSIIPHVSRLSVSSLTVLIAFYFSSFLYQHYCVLCAIIPMQEWREKAWGFLLHDPHHTTIFSFCFYIVTPSN